MDKRRVGFLAVVLFFVCQGDSAMALELKSKSFINNSEIARQYTCEGRDISPQLSWKDAPSTTKSFALICDDPDAPMGTWVHWVVYNIPAEVNELPEALPKTEMLGDGTSQGINDSQVTGYSGPCPPAGRPHRYFFKLYALDTKLEISRQVTKRDLVAAMKGHILAEAAVMATYER